MAQRDAVAVADLHRADPGAGGRATGDRARRARPRARHGARGRVARRGQLYEDAVGLAELAAADTELRAANSHLRRQLDDAHDLAAPGEPIDAARQARILLAAMHGCDVAVAATSTAHALAGAAAVFDASPILRALLDVQTARQHALFGQAHRAPLIAAAAGREVIYPPYLT